MLFLVSPIAHYNFSSLITPHRECPELDQQLKQSEFELSEFNKNSQVEVFNKNSQVEVSKPSYFIHSSLEGGGEYDSWPMAKGESARCCCPPPTLWSPSSTPPLSLLPQPKVSKAP